MSRAVARIFALACATVAPVSTAVAQQHLVVHVEGSVQGTIEGDSTFAQALNAIDAFEYHHRITDLGGQKHGEVIFTKGADRATVNLWTAFDDAETLTVRFEHWDPIQGGTGKTLEVELQGATVFAIEPIFSPGALPRERLRLRYDTMTVTHRHLRGDGSLDPPESYTVNGVFN